MQVLVTGGTGYIGSHTVCELLESGYDVVVVDNLCNSKKEVIDSIKQITGKNVIFYHEDVCNKNALEKIFGENKIDAVIHFAGLKAVGESVEKPLLYYKTNLDSTISLLETMKKNNVKKIVFSSSATVYGKPKQLPIKENDEVGKTTNPYGTTKFVIERMLKDLFISDNSWSIAILRYFNPVGAHKSGLIGENPNGIPNNLMPYIMKVAIGELPMLKVYGNDYNTHDGTGVRDYIHVVDLAKGHIKAIEKIDKDMGIDFYNLGTGNGYSVLDMINTFEKINNVKINYKIVERRQGDIDVCFADPSYAEQKLNWHAQLDLEDMCKDGFNFIKKQKARENKWKK